MAAGRLSTPPPVAVSPRSPRAVMGTPRTPATPRPQTPRDDDTVRPPLVAGEVLQLVKNSERLLLCLQALYDLIKNPPPSQKLASAYASLHQQWLDVADTQQSGDTERWLRMVDARQARAVRECVNLESIVVAVVDEHARSQSRENVFVKSTLKYSIDNRAMVNELLANSAFGEAEKEVQEALLKVYPQLLARGRQNNVLFTLSVNNEIMRKTTIPLFLRSFVNEFNRKQLFSNLLKSVDRADVGSLRTVLASTGAQQKENAVESAANKEKGAGMSTPVAAGMDRVAVTPHTPRTPLDTHSNAGASMPSTPRPPVSPASSAGGSTPRAMTPGEFVNLRQTLEHYHTPKNLTNPGSPRGLQTSFTPRPAPGEEPTPEKAACVLPRVAEDVMTLVLDMDETLVHTLQHGDNTVVLRRPGLESFLKTVARFYDVVVFTAGTQDYADYVLDQIDPKGYIRHRLYRQHTTPKKSRNMWGRLEDVYIKDLHRLQRDLSRTIIVDNTPKNYALNKDNGIPIPTWTCDPNDVCLHVLADWLVRLHDSDPSDVRPVISSLSQRNDSGWQKLFSRQPDGVSPPRMGG